jgi:hypothetical protein
VGLFVVRCKSVDANQFNANANSATVNRQQQLWRATMADTKSASEQLDEAIKAAADATARVAALKEQSRAEDLATVKKHCSTHGFTATDLKGFLVVKRGGAAQKATPRKSAPRKKAK